MATDLTALKKILNNETLLEEEKKMWLRIGIYVSASTKMVSDGYSGTTSKSTMYDAAGNQVNVSPIVAKNIRISIIEWWQIEKAHPRSEELKRVQQDSLGELENRNVT